jgi:hypothetical protein
MIIFKPGWKPDQEDRNDYRFEMHWGETIDKKSDLEYLFPECWDQKNLGTCNAFGTLGLVWAA